MHFNIINPKAIDRFLDEACPSLRRLTCEALARALRRETGCLRRLDELAADALPAELPAWLDAQRADSGDYYVWIGPDPVTAERVAVVRSWLRRAVAEDHAWLYDIDRAEAVDNGRHSARSIGR